jgi:hypothetical protein
MFERIFNGIGEFFSDLLPDEFCFPCFLKGLVRGLSLGLVALAAIAAAPAWLAIALTVGLLAFGVYSIMELAKNWDQLNDQQKSEALGDIAGGLLAGRFGPKIPPTTIKVPTGIRVLEVMTPEGTRGRVPVIDVTPVPVSIAPASSAVGAGTGATAAMMSSTGSGDGQQPEKEPEKKPRGSANPETKKASSRGSTLHSDKPGHLPDQLREQYPDTDFKFNKPGQLGQDVEVVGGKHPSEYPGSTWPEGVNHGDFKPDTPSGRSTFKSDQKHKWSQPTQILPYDPATGKLVK